jgi:glycosyltransferase involved in cell wall biosynthesis
MEVASARLEVGEAVPASVSAVANGGRRFRRVRYPRVTVVIPTLNEERNLPGVLAGLPALVDELIVVDARSTDGTVAAVMRLWPGARVIEQPGTGKGDALALGFAAATGDIIVTLDGDGSTDPAEIPRFLLALISGADLVKGSRFLDGGGSDDLTLVRRLGARKLTVLVNLLFGTEYTDLCYGYNAFWRDCLGRIAIATGFEVEASMHISATRAGLVVAEVPSFERARVHGASHLRTIRDGLRVLKAILGHRARRRPRPEPSVARA